MYCFKKYQHFYSSGAAIVLLSRVPQNIYEEKHYISLKILHEAAGSDIGKAPRATPLSFVNDNVF